MPTVIRLVGMLNGEQRQRNIRRHEALRTTFDMVERQLMQVIASSLSVSLPLIDLQELPAAERQAEAKRLVTEETQLVLVPGTIATALAATTR